MTDLNQISAGRTISLNTASSRVRDADLPTSLCRALGDELDRLTREEKERIDRQRVEELARLRAMQDRD